MKIEFDIEKEFIEQAVVNSILKNLSYEATEARYGARKGVEIAVKEFIYSRKEEIIQEVIEKASKEIIRKAAPKLLPKLMEVLTHE